MNFLSSFSGFFVKKLMFLVFVLPIFSVQSLFAQTAESKEFGAYMSALSPQEAASLDRLFHGMTPDIYISAKFNKNDNHPLLCRVQDALVDKLYETDSRYEDVLAISIYIANPSENVALDVQKMKSFKKLKYILFVYTFKANLRPVVNESKGMSPVMVLYKISIPC